MKNRILGIITAVAALAGSVLGGRRKQEVVPYIAHVPTGRDRARPHQRRASAPHGPQRSERRVAMDLRDARKRRNRIRNKESHR